MNRIPFQPGLGMTQFLAEYDTEAQCEAALEKFRWPQGFECPKCKGQQYIVYSIGRVKVFQCRTSQCDQFQDQIEYL